MDTLAESLLLIARRNGRTLSRDALVSGLPLVENALTPTLFVRAAQRIGYSARIIKRPLKGMSGFTLPAVLILKENRACVLNSVSSNKEAEILLPESGGGSKRLPLEELKSEYTGNAIFVQPVPDLEESQSALFFGSVHGRFWFWRVLFSYWRIYLEVIFASFLINLFVIASPIFVMNVYDRVIPNQAESTLWVLAIGVLAVLGFDFVLRIVRGYFVQVAGKRADVVLASRIFSQILDLRLEDRPSSSGAFANIIREFENVRDFISSSTLVLLLDLPFSFLFILIIYILSGDLALVPLTAVPLILIFGLFIQIPLSKVVQQNLSAGHRKHALLIETVTELETVKVIGAQSTLQGLWERGLAELARIHLQTGVLSSLTIFFSTLVQQMVTIGIVLVGFYEIKSGALSLGGLIAAMILSGRSIAPLGQVAGILVKYQQTRKSLGELNRIMSLTPERSARKQYLTLPEIRGDIEFHEVRFTYPGNEPVLKEKSLESEKTVSLMTPALENVSFRIAAGERVGILGRVGSGKTTILKLILGLYQPPSGAIRIDGFDKTQFDPVDLRKNIAYLPQGAHLFQGSIRDNLIFGNSNIDENDFLRALELSGLSEWLRRHPDGIEIQVGERGEHLSGGQRQLVAIARALISNQPMILMDEPSASLDNTAEQRLITNLNKFVEGKTLILVTHKVPLLSLVNRLIVMDEGRIVADGPKSEVLKTLMNQGSPPTT